MNTLNKPKERLINSIKNRKVASFASNLKLKLITLNNFELWCLVYGIHCFRTTILLYALIVNAHQVYVSSIRRRHNCNYCKLKVEFIWLSGFTCVCVFIHSPFNVGATSITTHKLTQCKNFPYTHSGRCLRHMDKIILFALGKLTPTHSTSCRLGNIVPTIMREIKYNMYNTNCSFCLPRMWFVIGMFVFRAW